MWETSGKMWETRGKQPFCFSPTVWKTSCVALELPCQGVSFIHSLKEHRTKKMFLFNFFRPENVVQLRHQPPRCPLHSVVEPLCLQGVPRHLLVPGRCLPDPPGEKDGVQRGNVLQDSCGRGGLRDQFLDLGDLSCYII